MIILYMFGYISMFYLISSMIHCFHFLVDRKMSLRYASKHVRKLATHDLAGSIARSLSTSPPEPEGPVHTVALEKVYTEKEVADVLNGPARGCMPPNLGYYIAPTEQELLEKDEEFVKRIQLIMKVMDTPFKPLHGPMEIQPGLDDKLKREQIEETRVRLAEQAKPFNPRPFDELEHSEFRMPSTKPTHDSSAVLKPKRNQMPPEVFARLLELVNIARERGLSPEGHREVR